jgi:hypothetical protein
MTKAGYNTLSIAWIAYESIVRIFCRQSHQSLQL